MSDRLRAVRVRDDLRLEATDARRAIRVVRGLRRRVARGRGLGRGLPLRDARGQLDEVVLLAGAVPLRDPASGEWWRGVRGTLGAGGRRSCHGEDVVFVCRGCDKGMG